MHLMRRLWLCFFLMATSLLVEPNVIGSQVDVDYKTQPSVTLHEPVLLTFTVRNLLSQPITIELGAQSSQFFEFALTTPDGQTFENHRNPRDEVSVVIVGSGKIEIAPGARYEQSLLMNQWFEFKTAGTYFLTSRLTSKIEVSGGERVTPQSETVRLVIKPRDTKRLQKVCSELAQQVDTAPTAEAAQFPAMKLSYIDDPVAVPFLAAVQGYAKLTDQLVIPGLERIGTDDAVRVLLGGLDSGFEYRISLSRQALMRMQERISDPRLRETVKLALKPKLS